MSGVRTEEKRQHFCFWHVRGSNQGPLELCTRLSQVDQDAIFFAHNLRRVEAVGWSTVAGGELAGINADQGRPIQKVVQAEEWERRLRRDGGE